MKRNPKLPFSRIVGVTNLPSDGLLVRVEAEPEERRALARVLNLGDIGDVTADIRLVPARAGSVRVEGEVRASVTQTCVVTLEPLPATVREDVDVLFAPWALDESEQGTAHTAEDQDPPDPLVDGQIDVGALTVEFLALGLDPYPRKPGATLDPSFEPPATDKPFGALAALRQKLDPPAG
jgi:hypothetical protein